MKIIVAGSRDFTDFEKVRRELDDFLCKYQSLDKFEIVSGHARGADTLGEEYAALRGLKLKLFPAKWKQHGKAAGPIRNIQMAKYADMLFVFINNESSGSMHMLQTIKSMNKPFVAYFYRDGEIYITTSSTDFCLATMRFHDYDSRLSATGQSDFTYGPRKV